MKKDVPRNLIDLSQRKKSFTIKTSVQQTRFSMKAIKEHMDQFIKHSNWVLVNSKGEKLGNDLSQHQDGELSPGGQSQNSSVKKGLLGKYKKLPISMEEPPENLGIHYEKKMAKKQFRACMGLLGLESNAFLSDRIFEVVDTDKDDYINFA